LFEALKETKYYAVAKIAMHNREHIVVVRRTEEFRTGVTNVSEREMNLAKMLVESPAAEFELGKYHDTCHIAPVIDIAYLVAAALRPSVYPNDPQCS
jgi:non-homologous end joining protein Ku